MNDMTTSNVPENLTSQLHLAFLSDFWAKKVVHRSFQPSWFNQWKFLHYDESRDIVFLPHTCLKGFEQKKMRSNQADPAFVCNSTLSAVANYSYSTLLLLLLATTTTTTITSYYYYYYYY